MRRKPETVAQYLAGVDAVKRAALKKLRVAIKAALPGAEECMAYGIPSYRLHGKLVVSFGVGRDHCSLYAGSTPLERYERELSNYSTSKGTVRFAPDRPLPAALVQKLVRVQVAARIRKPSM